MKGMAKRENDVMIASTDEFAGSESTVIDSTAPVEDNKPTSPPPSSKTSKEETVMIRLNANHKCRIGGRYYVFEKLKAYPVPPDVKRVLQQAGLLTAL